MIDGNKPAHAKMTLTNTTLTQIRGARKRRKNPEDGAYEGGKVDWDRCNILIRRDAYYIYCVSDLCMYYVLCCYIYWCVW